MRSKRPSIAVKKIAHRQITDYQHLRPSSPVLECCLCRESPRLWHSESRISARKRLVRGFGSNAGLGLSGFQQGVQVQKTVHSAQKTEKIRVDRSSKGRKQGYFE